MNEFKQYRRKQIAELRSVTPEDINDFRDNGEIITECGVRVSISEVDLIAGSPKVGDRIARNPSNHKDQWLVAEEYFINNFEPL